MGFVKRCRTGPCIGNRHEVMWLTFNIRLKVAIDRWAVMTAIYFVASPRAPGLRVVVV